MLRHQLDVVLRANPTAKRKLTWTDRAFLAALCGLLPRERLADLRLLVTAGTVLRWHREILACGCRIFIHAGQATGDFARLIPPVRSCRRVQAVARAGSPRAVRKPESSGRR
jgi:hypothetical protein